MNVRTVHVASADVAVHNPVYTGPHFIDCTYGRKIVIISHPRAAEVSCQPLRSHVRSDIVCTSQCGFTLAARQNLKKCQNNDSTDQ